MNEEYKNSQEKPEDLDSLGNIENDSDNQSNSEFFQQEESDRLGNTEPSPEEADNAANFQDLPENADFCKITCRNIF